LIVTSVITSITVTKLFRQPL